MIETLLYSYPWRPVDGWWQRALGIMQGRAAATVTRDGARGCRWIKQAMRAYVAAEEAGTSDLARLNAYQHFPYIMQARWIYDGSGALPGHTEENPVRWGIEAQILARESNEEIADKNGCHPDTIEAYEALFFNVRERLDKPLFIFNYVLGAAVTRGLAGRSFDMLWKMMGYLGGPYALEALISHVPNPMWAHGATGVPSFFQDTAINMMKMKAMVASISVPVDRATHLALIESFVKYVEIERMTDSVGSARDQIQDNLQEMVSLLPFNPISEDKVRTLAASDTRAAELRTPELLLEAAGLPIMDDETANLTFPEAKNT